MTSWGILPRWKARALALSEIQSVIREARADSGSALPDDKKAPRLAADAAEFEADFADLMSRVSRLRETQDFINRCDAAEARCDALAKGENARQALLDAEAEFTADDEDDPIATRH